MWSWGSWEVLEHTGYGWFSKGGLHLCSDREVIIHVGVRYFVVVWQLLGGGGSLMILQLFIFAL